MAKKKKVSDLALEAFQSALLFNDEPTTAEKNSEGESLPEEFFAESEVVSIVSEQSLLTDDHGVVGADADQDMDENIDVETSIFLKENEDSVGFLPDVSDEEEQAEITAAEVSVEGTELDGFESADIEDVEFVEEERLESIIESILFASDRPVSVAALKLVFKGTNINSQKIRRVLDTLAVGYAGGRRGITLEEVPGGYQLRTKVDNMEFMRRSLKSRPFRLSGPALEVLAITAYKQPLVKSEVDEIRGVESGHLLRALMEKNLVCFEGKSELPGRPMQYGTTKKFLEIFGLRNLKELPTLSQIDELLPEGIGDEDETEKATLSTITDSMAELVGSDYSQGEEELNKITEQLEEITTSSDFFEKEKLRQREKRDQEKAQNIRDALIMGESVPNRDINWLKRYDEALAVGQNPVISEEPASADAEGSVVAEEGNAALSPEAGQAVAAFDAEANAEEIDDEENQDDLDEELPFFGDADDIDEEGNANA